MGNQADQEIKSEIYQIVQAIAAGSYRGDIQRWTIKCSKETYDHYKWMVKKYPQAFSIFGIIAEENGLTSPKLKYNDKRMAYTPPPSL